MGDPRPARSAAGDGPARGEAALILLTESSSEVERHLVERWLHDEDVRPSLVLHLDGPELARSLATAPPDTLVTAVRVVWLPRERGGERRVYWSDFLSGRPLTAWLPR